jgi:hypothetical protein
MGGRYARPGRTPNISWRVVSVSWLRPAPADAPRRSRVGVGPRGAERRRCPWAPEPAEEARLNSAKEFGSPNVGHPTPVGIYPLGNTPEGICDLAGNVWEWTRSLWGKDLWNPEFGYPYRPGKDRENLDAPRDVRRVLRGGSWGYPAGGARCADRGWRNPDFRDVGLGFRVVASPFAASGLRSLALQTLGEEGRSQKPEVRRGAGAGPPRGPGAEPLVARLGEAASTPAAGRASLSERAGLS